MSGRSNARWTDVVFLVALLPAIGHASSFNFGDVLVGGRPAYPIGEGGKAYVDKFSSTGTGQDHVAVLDGGHPREMICIGSDVIVADHDHLTRIASDGSVSTAAPVFFDRIAASLAVNASGDIYVGDLLGARITKVSSVGTSSRYMVPVDYPGVLAMDLEPDQCTMLYASGGPTVRRYDFCTNKPLTDFARVPTGFVLSIRILEGGDVLVGSSERVFRFNSGGSVTQTYASGNAVSAISLVPLENTMWIGTGVAIEKIDLTSGDVLIGPVPVVLPPQVPPGFTEFPAEAVLVVGDRRVAQGEVAGVPMLSSSVALLMIIVLRAIALHRMRSSLGDGSLGTPSQVASSG